MAGTKKQRPVLFFFLGLICVSCFWGLGLSRLSPSLAQSTLSPPPIVESTTTQTTDIVPSQYLVAQELYMKNCATCHFAIPPAVLPRQTWSILLRDPSHYGAVLDPIREPEYSILAKYLSRYSRSLDPEEAIPYRISSSRYFKLIHPRVQFEQPVRLSTCITCHPKAPAFNFRVLTDAWNDAP